MLLNLMNFDSHKTAHGGVSRPGHLQKKNPILSQIYTTTCEVCLERQGFHVLLQCFSSRHAGLLHCAISQDWSKYIRSIIHRDEMLLFLTFNHGGSFSCSYSLTLQFVFSEISSTLTLNVIMSLLCNQNPPPRAHRSVSEDFS